jgi:hypothetical protein
MARHRGAIIINDELVEFGLGEPEFGQRPSATSNFQYTIHIRLRTGARVKTRHGIDTTNAITTG